MMALSSLVEQFESLFLSKYQSRLLPGHKAALTRMKLCRSRFSPQLLARCSNDECTHQSYIAHSCGHRNCPHCQHHESQQWIEKQIGKRVSASYYLLTFTLPKEFRNLVWRNQRQVYNLMFDSIKAVLMSFAQHDKELRGQAGFTMVLHTHARNLDYHPHLHVIMPGAAADRKNKLWRVKSTKYLFDRRALAKVFRAKFLQTLVKNGLPLPDRYPGKWVVHCKQVGDGRKAIIYLGNYLYKGVILEKNIIRCENGEVTFRYKDAKSKTFKTKTVKGEDFLWRLVQHVLPKGFRKVRDYGFLHGSSKQLIRLLQIILKIDPVSFLKQRNPRPVIQCPRCGAPMRIVQTMIRGIPNDSLLNSA